MGVVLVGAAIGAGVVVEPRLALAGPLAAVSAILIWLYPKTCAALVALGILLSQGPTNEIPSFTIFDEASILGLFVVVAAKRLYFAGSLHRMPGAWLFALYGVAGVLSSTVHAVPISLTVSDGFLFTKGAVFAFAVAQIDWTREDVRWLIKWGCVVCGVIVGAVVINAAIPGPWYSVFSNSGSATHRGGLAVLIGPFKHPGALGQVMALMSAAFLAHRLAFGPSRFNTAGLAVSVLGVIASIRRKAIVAVVATLGYLLVTVRRTRPSALVVTAVIAPVLLVVTWDSLASVVSSTYDTYFLNGDDVARSVLYSTSIDILVSHFPLGVGFGRFGGEIASTNYSPVYVRYGFTHVYGLEPGGHFTTDTFWPAIAGEAGFLGLVAYAGGLVAMFRAARRLATTAAPELRFVGLVASAWSVEFFLESIASAVYSSPPAYPLLFGVMGLTAALWRIRDEDGDTAAE